ncbi:MAG: hypothetical protein ACRCWO_02765 [Bosea sp. (in: a-proteobacteria)]
MRTILVILDGVGLADPSLAGNAATPETLPVLHDAMLAHGRAVLEASGPAVGLDEGQAGNSEIGHLTIGAGHVVPSTLQRIEAATQDGSWADHPLWKRLAHAPRLHIIGLLSDAGTHGHWRSLAMAARLAGAAGLRDVFIHPVLDGVDSVAGSAPLLLERLEGEIAGLAGVRLGVITGRKSFSDRSGDLTQSAPFMRAVCGGQSLPEFSHEALAGHLQTGSEAGFQPHLAAGGRQVAEGEAVLLTQNRADRAVQVARLLAVSTNLHSLVELDGAVPREKVFFPVQPLARGLGFEIKARGLTSVRIAENCKFPHVTYFLNGLNPGLEGKEICLPTVPESEFAAHPEMSADAIADAAIAALKPGGPDLIIVNIANLDQIGHLGHLGLAVSAARSVDAALARIAAAAETAGVCLFITSDHGNADKVLDESGKPFGSHTLAPVPFTARPPLGRRVAWRTRSGSLADIAPTVLASLGVPPPDYMGAPLALIE